MPGVGFIGLHPFQWIALLVALLTLLVLVDAWAGHYRRGFIHGAQYAPFISGGVLIICAVAAAIAPRTHAIEVALRAAGWLAIAAGLIGFCFHHYYGVIRKPGGYGRFLNSVMYGAPPLAPLALAAMGVFALITRRGLVGASDLAGLPIRTALLATIVVCLFGSIVQAGILHFRGAFNNPLMYAPLTIPVLTTLVGIWMMVEPSPAALVALGWLFWLTLLTGFVGLGMHLRGFDRQMAGLYVPLFNWLQGPPAMAPALFVGLAAIGLVTTGLL
ncbi:MAG: hypothetical protein ACREVV_05220 [Steroidobacteraceae bacterium]